MIVILTLQSQIKKVEPHGLKPVPARRSGLRHAGVETGIQDLLQSWAKPHPLPLLSSEP